MYRPIVSHYLLTLAKIQIIMIVDMQSVLDNLGIDTL